MDGQDPEDRRRSARGDKFLRPLRHDDARARGFAQRQRHPPNSRAAQRGERRCLREGDSRRHNQTRRSAHCADVAARFSALLVPPQLSATHRSHSASLPSCQGTH